MRNVPKDIHHSRCFVEGPLRLDQAAQLAEQSSVGRKGDAALHNLATPFLLQGHGRHRDQIDRRLGTVPGRPGRDHRLDMLEATEGDV